MIQHSTVVKAPLVKVWEQLLVKIEQPQLFIPGVSQVQLLEQKEAMVKRQMTLTTEMGATVIQEEITYQPYHIRFALLSHPLYEGYVDNDAKAISDVETEITFSMHWTHKITHEPMQNIALLEQAVLKTKDYIEKL